MFFLSLCLSIFICILQTFLWISPYTVAGCGLSNSKTVMNGNSCHNSNCNSQTTITNNANGINSRVKPPGCDRDDPRFDYYLLVLQWPYAFSQTNYMRDFTIHGLWPSRSYDELTYPCYCKALPLDMRLINPYYVSKMMQYWPSFVTSNERFWEHEWTKHGTCSNGMSLSSYFETTLELRDRYNPLLPLSEFISQGENNMKFYYVNDIKNALYNAYGVNVSLGCKKFSNRIYQHLSEVAICLSKGNPFVPFKGSCPMNLRKNMSSEIANCDPTKPIAIPYPITSSQQKNAKKSKLGCGCQA